MPYPTLASHRWLLIPALLSATPAAFGQSPGAPPADSLRWRDTKPDARHGLGAMIVEADGRRVRAYLPTDAFGFEALVPYLSTNPEVRPFPKTKVVKVELLRSMTVRERYYETMRLPGDAHPRIMAWRVVNNGPVELFVYSDSAVPMVPLLGLGVGLLTAALSTIPNSHWYLRRDGQLVPMERVNFREQMSQYVQDCVALRTQIQGGADGFRYSDMPNIVSLYNQYLLEQSTRPASAPSQP
ncbi:hypothetical protein [Hymenobacter jeollabukensis]|uniref:GLPGLI family protein n=1 Tax=Hymenobacter jeollabukensis TaxID=2025313 RepID=A0A5R8WV75_9BACT|nr:hypothetical protein [Hymenobacter jeollabukensis]TLM95304.1 hypothetical protein FDY95_05820 [Hymenobacter jeollabukensis]